MLKKLMMKLIFKGLYKKSEKEIEEIWKDAIITFDANVLLNLYRYSDNTRNELLKKIKELKGQIWLSHQACFEYHKNRYEVIAEQEKACKIFNKKIQELEDSITDKNRPPFLNEELLSRLLTNFEDVKNDIIESANMFAELQKKDEIYEKLNNIFEEKIGAEFEKDKLEKIYQEGAIRYQKKIPPGFEDEKNKNGVNKFGDLIMWEQIKIKAKESQRNLILVTDERKKDWWWKLRDGKVIGPRYELVNEIWGFAEIDFLMYSSDRFLSYSYRYLNEQVDENVIEEIKDRKWVESDIAEYKRLVWLSDFFTEYNKTKDQSEIINYEEFNTGLQGEHRSFLSDRYILNIKELDEKLKYLEGKDDEKNNKERFLLEEKRIKMIEEFYDFLNIE